jgi:DNA-binding transcriptional MerR regulator
MDTKRPNSADEWTLAELGDRVVQALSEGYEQAASRRVRAIPNQRTIRYYTTLGLLSKPLAWRGRTALYGRRHLMEIVAIKRLQAKGLSLAQIQQRLAGIGQRNLEKIANLPTCPPAPPSPPPTAERRRDTAFWKTGTRPPASPPADEPPLPRLQGLHLARSVQLILLEGRGLSPGQEARLRRAAQPLLNELRNMGLLE